MAYGGSILFNPLVDSLSLPNGESFQFASPTGDIWPEQGYQRSLEFYQPPKDAGSKVQLEIDPRSERIQLIAPFEPWGGEDEQVVETLIKVKGKCSEFLHHGGGLCG
jgi:aconitate hydratase